MALFSDTACLCAQRYGLWPHHTRCDERRERSFECNIKSCRTWCGAELAKLMLWMVCVSLGFLERKRLLGGNCGGAVLWGPVLCNLWCHHSQRERCSGRVHRWPTGLRVELQGGNDLSMSRRVINIFIIAIIFRSMFCLSLKAEFTLHFSFIIILHA